MRGQMAGITLSLALGLMVVALSTTVTHAAPEAATVRFSFDSQTSQVLVAVDSPLAISGADIKLDIPADIDIGTHKLAGFVIGAAYMNMDTVHRWFQMSANGEKSGSLVVNVTVPENATYTITLLEVNLLDVAGEPVPIDTPLLPAYVEVGQEETTAVIPVVVLSPSVGTAGTEISVSGTGFVPNETGIQVTYDGILVASGIVADEGGTWTATFVVPDSAKGDYVVDAWGGSTSATDIPDIIFTVEATSALPSEADEGEKEPAVDESWLPGDLGTWPVSSWIVVGSLLLVIALLIPQGVPALISKRRRRYAPVAPEAVVPLAQAADLSATFRLTKPEISLGSGADNDMVITDASVDDKHARIYQEAGRDVVEDLGSTAGTSVSYSGQPDKERKVAARSALKEGSYIRLGKATPVVFHTEPRSLVVNYALASGKVNSVGSDSSNDIVINSPSVSEKHAEIGWKAGAFVIKDLGSQQGTFIRYGGEASPERRVRGTNAIKDGSIIRVGNTQFLVETGNTGDTT